MTPPVDPGSERARRLAWDASLLLSALLIAVGYLRLGVGHVLDDWFALRNAHFLGTLRAAGADQIAARPLGSVVYAGVFGLLGQSIAPVILLMAVVNAGSAMLLRRLLVGITTVPVALATAWLWLVVPSVTSIEVWASASNISVALVCGLGALRAVQTGPIEEGSRRGSLRLTVAVALAAGAVLSYEALVVLAVAGALLLLLLGERRDRSRVLLVAGTIAGSMGAFGWVLLHWHPRKDVTSVWGEVIQVLPANLGPGIAQGLAWVVLGVPVLVVTLLAALPSFRSVVGPTRHLVALGWFTMGVGVLPFVKYTYAPAAAGDRVNVISSLGGAMLLAATIDVVLRHRTRLLPLATVVVATVTLPTRVQEMRPWGDAAADADLIMEAVRTNARPGEPVVLGPHLVDRDGVTAMQLSYIAAAAIQLAVDDAKAEGSLTASVEEFDAADGTKIDLRDLLTAG